MEYKEYERRLDELNYRSQVRSFADDLYLYMLNEKQGFDLWEINQFIARFVNQVLRERLGEREVATTPHKEMIILRLPDSENFIKLGTFIASVQQWYRNCTPPSISKREYKNDFRDQVKSAMFDLIGTVEEEIF